MATLAVLKANCVRNELKIWETLLEVRIKLQKCLSTCNQLPQQDIYKEFVSDKEFMKTTNDTKNQLSRLLDNMLNLQSALLKQYPETQNLGKDEKPSGKILSDTDEETPLDTDGEIQTKEECLLSEEDEDLEEECIKSPNKKLKLFDYEKELDKRHQMYTNYRNSVIQKWNDKTRVAAGTLQKGSSLTILKQIGFALSDKSKLRKKTQLKRSEYRILGKAMESGKDQDEKRTQEYDPEIYDDDDFYHQLLRDLIEYKSSDVTDPIQLSKQWIKLQNMRNKMKRKIDTRATKGRRVRYNVHNKIVSFMAPVIVNDTWTDNAKTELYKSLFRTIAPVDQQIDH
ncbi:protein AATF [Prorops nasuta]|uniref:protein AATF n=1 Tax=Prorops nasuta TaxID=863751 RepID=UPI0034CD399C